MARRSDPSWVGVGEERAGWYCGSVRSLQRGGVKSILQVALETSILGGLLLLFSLEWWDVYTVRGVWLPSRLPLERTNHIYTREP
jgi:hypothetical protein